MSRTNANRPATKRQLVRIIEIAELDDDPRVIAALKELGHAVSAASGEPVTDFDGADRYLAARLGSERAKRTAEREPSVTEKVLDALADVHPQALTAANLAAEYGCGQERTIKRALNELAKRGRIEEAGKDVISGRPRLKLWRLVRDR